MATRGWARKVRSSDATRVNLSKTKGAAATALVDAFFSASGLTLSAVEASDTASFSVSTSGISFVSSSNTTYASRTNTTVTAPSGIANDDLLIFGIFSGITATPAITPPSGFTQVGSTITVADPSSAPGEYRVYIKKAASESGNYTATHTACNSQAFMLVYRGVATTTPQDATATTNSQTGTGSTNTATWTGLTTVTAGAMIVATGFDWGDTTNNLSPPSGMTEALEVNPLVYAAHELRGTTGATGNRTHTTNSTTIDPWGAHLLALRPATSAPTFTLAATEGTDTASFSISAVTGLTLATTETSDTAAFSIANGLTLAATEGADTAVFNLSPVGSLTLAATEGADTAAFNIAAVTGFTLAPTEGADTASFAISAKTNLTLAVTEGSDTAAFSLSGANSLTLATTEGSDTAAFAVAAKTNLTLAATEAADTALFTVGGLTLALRATELPDTMSLTVLKKWRKSSSFFFKRRT